MKQRDKCAVCEEKSSSPLMSFENYPITETYVDKNIKSEGWVADQSFAYCGNCGHGQLQNILPQERLYSQENYKFRTSKSVWGSAKGNDYFLKFINKSVSNKKFEKIIEIGCNDAYLLESLKERANLLIGVDPVLEEDSKENIKLISDFYENTNLTTENSLVITHQVMEHLEDPKDLLQKLMETANKNTTFVFGFPSLDYLVHDFRFDQIFHHHQHYFSKKSSLYLLNEIGCECFNLGWNSHYWGTIMLAFSPSTKGNISGEKIKEQTIKESWEHFGEKMSHLEKFVKNSDRNLYCYGAGLQLPVLNYHVPAIDEKSKGIIDDDKSKSGLGYPNMETKIVHGSEVDLENLDVIITAINFSRNILPNVISKKPHRIYLPFNSLL